MRSVRYCLHGLFVLIKARFPFHLVCLLICSAVFAAIPSLFSNAMVVWEDNAWNNRVAKVTFREDVSAHELYQQLSNDPRINGFLMNLDIQQQGNESNVVSVNAVHGVIYERNRGDNKLIGEYDDSDDDLYFLRSMDVPHAYLQRMDEMTVLIQDQPYTSGGLCKAIGANYGDLPSLGKGLSVSYMGPDSKPQLFECKYFWGTLVVIPAGTAAKHDYPVSALEISFTELIAADIYHEVMAPFQDKIRRAYLPWSEEPLKPSFDQLPQDSALNLLSEFICLLNIMVLLLLWLGSFQGALRVWLHQGASRFACGLALFLVGLLMVVLSMALGYGIYALLLPLGMQWGIFAELPLNILSLTGFIFVTVALICLMIYCGRCVRTAGKGA